MPDQNVIRFGIAGMGVGRSRARAALNTPGAQLTAIYDRRQDNAAKLAAEWGCAAAGSFEELILAPTNRSSTNPYPDR